MSIELKDNQLLDSLRTVAVNGAYNASRALSKWLRRGVRLTSDGFQHVPLGMASSVVGEPDAPLAAVNMPLRGDIAGHMLLTFPEQVGLALADIMLEQPEGTSRAFGELEQSCLQETGNIVCSAYANSLAKWLRLRIEPAAPIFAHDLASAIIDPFVMAMVVEQDEVLMALTDFQLERQRLQWGMLLLPSHDSFTLMERHCRLDSMRQQALQTIAVNGAFNASRAMSKWLRRGVKVSTKGFTRIPLSEAAGQFPEDEAVVAMHLPLANQMQGHVLIVITREHALLLARLLLGTTDGSTAIGELEQSALQETANVIASSFVNSWSTWLDIHVEPGAPQLVVDLPTAIIDTVIAEQAQVGDDIFQARTDFVFDEQLLEVVFMLLPAPSALRLIETATQ